MDVHHVPQKHPAQQVIKGYNERTAPSIVIKEKVHRQLPKKKGIYDGSPRKLLADDVRDLRNRTSTPNSEIQKLIDYNKTMYPEVLKK